MKFFIAFLLTALLAFVCGLFFPWWSMAISSAVVAYFIYQRPAHAFFAGFLALFVFWITYALLIDNANDHLLSQKIAMIFHVSKSILLLLTGLCGGIVSGMAALTGSLLYKTIATQKATTIIKKETIIVEEV